MHAIKQMEVIPRKEDDPYARKSALGWGVIGNVNPTKNEEDDSHCSCHCIASLEVNLQFDERRRVLVGYTKEIDIDYIRTNLVPKPLELKQRMIKDADILLLQLFIERPAFLSIYCQAADETRKEVLAEVEGISEHFQPVSPVYKLSQSPVILS